MVRTVLFSFCFLLVSACGGGDSQTAIEYTSVNEFVAANSFSGTILVQKSGADVLRNAYGYADRANSRANTLDTRFRIGSVTKSFTALAIVQLKKAGQLGYDDRLSDHLAGYPRGDEITVRQLLQHRSGVAEYTQFIDPARSYTPTELIALVQDRPLSFTPGQQFAYSNSNYLILGRIVELLANTSYADYVRTNITGPLGMAATEYGASNIQGADYALGYRDSEQRVDAAYLDMSIPYAAGALSSSLSDLERWGQSFLQATLVDETDLSDIFSGDYGFGWFVSTDSQGRQVYSHSGGVDGFSSLVLMYPASGDMIVVLSNIEASTTLGPMINRIVEMEF